ncbi:hypothetical protein EIP91_004130 [Steccherinum ochraceum]|uniref:Uncharacterized protein n=1 Tax=Steccherinum ochraceum TaxID=92696 RepID=A0A4R0RCF4_9APHY|nr:hypothetical protein EIP91_004130 [Steccherinum ochraceum]
MDIFGSTRSTLPPRPIDGVDSELPPLADVMFDIKDLRSMMSKGYPDTDEELLVLVAYMKSANSDGGWLYEHVCKMEDGRAPIGLAQYCVMAMLFRSLMTFCLIVTTEDEDMLPEYIWAQRRYIRLYMETTPEERFENLCSEHVETDLESFRRLSYFRRNLSICLMSPQIKRPADALLEIEAAVDHHISYLQSINSQHADTPWLDQPWWYVVYAEARVLSNHLDMDTKNALDRAYEVMTCLEMTIDDNALHIVIIRVSLALILQVLCIEPDKQKEHTEWSIVYLRKRPQLKGVVCIPFPLPWVKTGSKSANTPLVSSNGPHDIAMIVGLERKRDSTYSSAPDAIEYSTVQKNVRGEHGPGISSTVNQRHQFRTLHEQGKTTGTATRLSREVIKWMEIPHFPNADVMIHALALPKDLSRARTHMVFRLLKPSPRTQSSQSLKDKFYVAKCGVFKIEDVLHDIMFVGRHSNEQETKDGINRLLKSTPGSQLIPGQAIHTMLMTWVAIPGLDGVSKLDSVTFLQDKIRRTTYDLKWREKVNHGQAPPQQIIPFSGAADAEFDYEESNATLGRNRRAASMFPDDMRMGLYRLIAAKSSPYSKSSKARPKRVSSAEDATKSDGSGPLVTNPRANTDREVRKSQSSRPGEDDPEELRRICAHLPYSPEEMDEFIHYLQMPCDVQPVPSKRTIQTSHQKEYSFGFYIHDPTYRAADDSQMDLGEMIFMVDMLSHLMLRRPVALRRVVITATHKEQIPEVEEDVGKTGLILEVLTTDDLPDGHLPTNREVKELGGILERKPFW